jgi:cell division septation protein DedD
MLLGFVFGSVVCSFYLGTYAGREAGFELATDRSRMAMPKELIPELENEKFDLEKKRELDKTKSMEIAAPKIEESTGEISPATASPGGDMPFENSLSEAEGQLVAKISESLVIERDKGQSDSQMSPSVEMLPQVNLENKKLEQESDAQTLGDMLAVNELAKSAATPQLNAGAPQKLEQQGEVKALATNEIVAPLKEATPVAAPTTFILPPEKKELPKKVELQPTILKSGWYTQVFAPRSLDEANNVADKLKGLGFRVSIEEALVRGQKYYRLLVGPEKTREVAEFQRQQIIKKKLVDSDPFVRVVK